MTKRPTDEEWTAWLGKQPPLNPLPPRVRAEVQRILDGAARRVLQKQLAGMCCFGDCDEPATHQADEHDRFPHCDKHHAQAQR